MPGILCHLNLARGYRGGERQTELLIRWLAETGVAQAAVVRRGEALARRLGDVPGLDLRPAPGHALAACFAARGGALLHAHETHGAQAACLRNLVSGTPYVVTRRVSNVPRRDPFTRRVYRRAAAVAAVAGSVARRVEDYAPGTRTTVIHSAVSQLPVDPARVADLRRRYSGRFLVGQVGALDEKTKGQTYLIEAARGLGELADLTVLLIGGGRDEALLRARAADVPVVELTGFVEDVGNWLSVLDVLVLPSMMEGIGGILLDAMQFGLPVVASRVGGLPEIVHDGVNGLLVEPRDVAGLQAAIRRLYGEPALRRRLGEAGREFVSAFTPANMAASYLALYEDILGARLTGRER